MCNSKIFYKTKLFITREQGNQTLQNVRLLPLSPFLCVILKCELAHCGRSFSANPWVQILAAHPSPAHSMTLLLDPQSPSSPVSSYILPPSLSLLSLQASSAVSPLTAVEGLIVPHFFFFAISSQ